MKEILKVYNSDYFSNDSQARIFEYHFTSLSQFLHYIQTMPINERIFEKLSSTKDNFEFTKTSCFEEAVFLCQNGWDEDFEKFISLKEIVSRKILKSSQLTSHYKHVTGYVPSVPTFIVGNPLNMWNRTKKDTNNIISFFVQLAYSSETRSSQIYNRGAILLSIIEALEKQGYAVQLNLLEASRKRNEYLISHFHLKPTTQYCNTKKLYFPLCHPSFLRRLNFRLLEVTEVQESFWQYDYGRVIKMGYTLRKLCNDENAIIVSTPNEIGIKGENIYEDLDIMLKFLNLEHYFNRL